MKESSRSAGASAEMGGTRTVIHVPGEDPLERTMSSTGAHHSSYEAGSSGRGGRELVMASWGSELVKASLLWQVRSSSGTQVSLAVRPSSSVPNSASRGLVLVGLGAAMQAQGSFSSPWRESGPSASCVGWWARGVLRGNSAQEESRSWLSR